MYFRNLALKNHFTFCLCWAAEASAFSKTIFSVSKPFSEAYTAACQETPNFEISRPDIKHFKKIAQRAGISDDARFHDLRHSFAVSSLYAGDDIKTVQANLGHATAQFTLDVYGHVTQKMRQDSANRMQKFYEQLSSENAQ